MNRARFLEEAEAEFLEEVPSLAADGHIVASYSSFATPAGDGHVINRRST